MTFSLVGTGFIFPVHTEAIRTIGGKIIDVVNTARGEKTWREVIRTTRAEYIVILTPNDLHYPMICAALDAGKKVLSEKPISLRSQDVRHLLSRKDVFSVLQLHYHPLVKALKNKISTEKFYDITIDISVYRDERYYKSWKGTPQRSGGVLFNLGIHYFDLVLYLFGKPLDVSLSYLDEKTGRGTLKGENYSCTFTISTAAPRDHQQRTFVINGEDYNFSSQDNLSYENLHGFVYQDLINQRGVTPRDTLPSIELIERINKSATAL